MYTICTYYALEMNACMSIILHYYWTVDPGAGPQHG